MKTLSGSPDQAVEDLPMGEDIYKKTNKQTIFFIEVSSNGVFCHVRDWPPELTSRYGNSEFCILNTSSWNKLFEFIILFTADNINFYQKLLIAKIINLIINQNIFRAALERNPK